jgi:probable HAF family extracellular repeat protein
MATSNSNRMQNLISRAVIVACAVLVFSASVAAASQYSISELPVPSGFTNCNVSRMNDAAEVAGTCYNSSSWRAVLWQKGAVVLLPVLTGFEKSTANSVGPGGQVVGWAEGLNGVHAKLWANSAVFDLGLLPGTSESLADDVNAAGVIVGYSDNRAVEWKNGKILDFGGYLGVRPSSINVGGRFVGFGIIAPGDVGGSLFDTGHPGAPLRYFVQSQFGAATTINGRDEVVGYDQSSSSSPRVPWKWRSRKFSYLPFLQGTSSCTPIGLNDFGVSVGGCGSFAVIWRKSGVADLNTLAPHNSGWQLFVATSISAKGVIVGDGYFAGQFQSFMLVPSPDTIRFIHTSE